jgi:hypothetical protein
MKSIIQNLSILGLLISQAVAQTNASGKLSGADAELAEVDREIATLKDVRNNREKYHKELLSTIASEKETGSRLRRLFNSSGGYLGCVEAALAEGIKSYKRCDLRFNNASVSDALKEKMRVYNEYVLRDDGALGVVEYRLMEKKDKLLKNSNVSKSPGILPNPQGTDTNQPRQVAMVDCGPQTPVLDLEKPARSSGIQKDGPFYAVPHDNQDSVGTCYSNTARNLLYAVTDGQVDASFLDLAVNFKSEFESGALDVDGGSACRAMEAVKKIGFCPKNYSPIENGDAIAEGLISGLTSLNEQSELLDMLKKFMSNRRVLENDATPAMKNFLGGSADLMKDLKNNPKISLPYPKLDGTPLFDARVSEAYFVGKKDGRITVSEKEYNQEVSYYHDSFRSKLVELLKQGYSTEAVASLVRSHYRPLAEKYHWTAWEDRIINRSFVSMVDRMDRKDFLSRVEATENFKNKVLGHETAVAGNTINCQGCQPKEIESNKISDFFQSVSDVFGWMRNRKINPDQLFDAQGDFRSDKEILQLALVPRCLNPENRKTIENDFKCHDYNPVIHANMLGQEYVPYTRSLIIDNLKKGIPVGNTFPTKNSRHINTIVGYRFNHNKGSCEIKIRESQNGTSAWHDERSVIHRMDRITIVEKE